jgi:hypothetical protein
LDRGKQAIALNKANGRIAYRFHARDLHLVMGPAREELPSDFACSSMEMRRAPLTELTLTSKGTARLPNSGCVS